MVWCRDRSTGTLALMMRLGPLATGSGKRLVSIEHVGTTANPPSYATLITSAQLMAALARSKGWRHLTMGDMSESTSGIHRLAVPREQMSTGWSRRPISI